MTGMTQNEDLEFANIWSYYISDLCELVDWKRMPGTCSGLFFEQLWKMDWYESCDLDHELDHYVRHELRRRYFMSHDGRYLNEYKTPRISVFEALVGLAGMMEDKVGSAEEGDRTYLWFSIFLEHMGLEKYLYNQIETYNWDDVWEKCRRWMERDYDVYGHGSPFPVPDHMGYYAQEVNFLGVGQQLNQYISLWNICHISEEDFVAKWRYLRDWREKSPELARIRRYIDEKL